MAGSSRRRVGIAQRTAAIIIVVIIIVAAAAFLAGRGGGEAPATTTTTTSPTGMTTTSPAGGATTTQAPGQACETTATVIETSQAYVVVGPKGACVPSLSGDKPIIAVAYVVDEAATKAIEESTGFVDINPAFYRNYTVDALIIAARKATDPFLRTQIYEAVYKLSNELVPILWLGQYQLVRTQWDWLQGRYYHPTLAERYDLLYEDPGAPNVPIGIGGYNNNASVYVIVTHGWPDTFDPAADYETFGWAIWHNIGDSLVTYWKDETEMVGPDLAVAWAVDDTGTTWYFVIRGGVVAYDPWHDKTYEINATDVLFSIWRIARLQLDPSWMITEFVDVNNSQVLTEEEFDQILAQGGLTASYKGETTTPTSLQDLLSFFGYDGETAGVVMLKLTQPYGAILSILADPFVSVIPMQYVFEYADGLGLDKYTEALQASEYGKNPAAWANYIGTGNQDPTHLLLNQYPVGTGPYYVKEYQENSYLVLEYNPYYWNKTLWNVQPYGSGGEPSHKTVIYLINDDANARIQILTSGTADTGAIPLDRLADINGTTYPGTDYKINVEVGGIEPTIVYIVLNAAKEPFNNLKVRQALMYAIPFDQIKDDVYAGYLARLYGVIPAGFPGHNDDLVIKYQFDVTKAQQLIQESGINPADYSIKIWYNSGNTQREKIANYLQTIWSRLGFDVTVEALQWGTLLDKTERGEFDVYIIGWAPDYLDPDNYAGPLFYGGTKFQVLDYQIFQNPADVESIFSP